MWVLQQACRPGEGGIDAWAERFNHIDDHFMGKPGLSKQSNQDWIPVNSDKPKGGAGSHALEDHSDSNSNGNPPDSAWEGDDDEENGDGGTKKRRKKHGGLKRPTKRTRKD